MHELCNEGVSNSVDVCSCGSILPLDGLVRVSIPMPPSPWSDSIVSIYPSSSVMETSSFYFEWVTLVEAY